MATQQLTIPMFPLGIVLLPGETKVLHIFEERYKQLVFDCLHNNAHFGIPFIANKSIGDFGIEVKINKVLKTFESGELDILIEGVSVFNLIKYSSILKPKLYGAGIIVYESINLTPPSMRLQDLIRDYLWTSQQKAIPVDAYDNSNLYTVARLLDLLDSEKHELIRLETKEEKESYLIKKIKLFSFVLNLEIKLGSKFILN